MLGDNGAELQHIRVTEFFGFVLSPCVISETVDANQAPWHL
jgi:hypothetical protein